ncbi:MAG: MarR family winged helix-turn-helix transcriptional regulator [Lysinibacillus sp.]
MYYKQLAKEFFDFMVKTNEGPMGPPDPKEYSRGEMGILIYLAFQKDGVPSGQLSEALHVSTGRVASALKSLEKKQLIMRRTDGADKRRVNVHLTDKGKESILEKHAEAIEQMEKSLRKLGKEDAKKFVELSKRFFS